MPFAMLWPTFALVLLIFIVWATMGITRFAHIRRVPPRREDFASHRATLAYFEPVELPANNLRNLFEMPVLYFALVPLLLVTHHGDTVQAVLAWTFVALRVVHSLIHIVVRRIYARFLVYAASNIVLSVMWIGFFIDMLHAASLYHQALGGAYPMR
ncbi:MAG: MAPEG family protein [Sphingomonas sp.]